MESPYEIDKTVRLVLLRNGIPFYLRGEIMKFVKVDLIERELDFSDGNFRYSVNEALFLNGLPPYSYNNKNREKYIDTKIINKINDYEDIFKKALYEAWITKIQHVPIEISIPFTKRVIISRSVDFATHFTIPDPEHIIKKVGIFIEGRQNEIELFEYNNNSNTHQLKSFKPPYSPLNLIGTPYIYITIKILEPDNCDNTFNLNYIGYFMKSVPRIKLAKQSGDGIYSQLCNNKKMKIQHGVIIETV